MSEYVGLKQGKVHDKREMSEYYCGGCGWPVTDHDSYCRECGGALHESYGKVPEQGERDDDSECESYDAGFESGMKATLQQLDGLISSGYDLKAVCAWIDRQWEEET